MTQECVSDMKKRRKKNKTPKQWLNYLFYILVSITALAIAATAIYLVFLSRAIDKRFSGRRWDIPSRVYSDTTLLYTGQRINRALLVEKLGRLGYRETSHPPGRQGEMQLTSSRIALYLHSFHTPIYNQKEMPVQIDLQGDRVEAITNPETRARLPLLELEPEELMLYYGPDRERRQLLSVRKLPPYVVHAVLAVEDHDFYKHHGFVLKGYLRAFWVNLKAGGIQQGGSTITLQLAKNYFLTPERTYRRKLKELLIALVLEYKFSKTDILEIYLNEIYWGQRGSAAVSGMAEAARFYFDKEVSKLSVAEAATLAGMIQAPNLYSPYRHPDACLKRRNVVLSAMRQWGWLRTDKLEGAMATPLKPAAYTAKGRQAPHFMDYLTDQLMELYSPETLKTEGLSIYTTIDTQVQSVVEEALSKGLAHLENSYPELKRSDPGKQLQGAVIVMQPKTGYIIAMSGGRDYGTSQFNRAAHALRQPGSAFKPFVFLTALDSYSPIDTLSNEPQTYMIDGNPWEPKNYSENAPPEVTFRMALAESQNIATVNLAYAVGLENVADTARAFHLPVSKPPYPSMALGAMEVAPLMLARAYCAFAADGVLPFPLSIKNVVDETGTVIESRHALIERLINPAKAYMVSDLLRSVVEVGTARSLKFRGVDWPVAGKTGTTNDSRDAWFVGYTPNILALVWVGFDDGESIHASGSSAALPIWADLMKRLPQYVSGEWFAVPPGVEKHSICLESGQLANDGCCPRTFQELFLTGVEQTETCGLHDCPSRF